jgi:glycosyltransferase involved in cell wall biosynthesis
VSTTPRVDIIMRTKNRPQFLARALDDILAQEYPHWHLIIVNDGGDPVQAHVAQRPGLDGRVTLLDLPESLGRGGAVMPGIEAGHAPYIAIHDDDDTWHPQFLTRTIQHLRSTDDVAVSVRTQIIWESPALQETGRELFHPFMQEPTYFDLLRFNHVVPISLLYRRTVHDVIAINSELRSVFDWDVNLQLWRLGSVGFLDGEPLAYWHQRRSADGDAANSVIAEPDSHYLHDRRVREKALRRVTHDGDLLFLTGFVDDRTQDLSARLDRVEAQFDEILRRLRG